MLIFGDHIASGPGTMYRMCYSTHRTVLVIIINYYHKHKVHKYSIFAQIPG